MSVKKEYISNPNKILETVKFHTINPDGEITTISVSAVSLENGIGEAMVTHSKFQVLTPEQKRDALEFLKSKREEMARKKAKFDKLSEREMKKILTHICVDTDGCEDCPIKEWCPNPEE